MSKSSSGTSSFPVMVTALVMAILVAIPVVAVLGLPSTDEAVRPTGVDKHDAGIKPATVEGRDLASFVENSTGSQMSFLRLSDGHRAGTATERFARPALSLIKLYIAEFVIAHGTIPERYAAIEMIRSSDDEIAATLYRKYPESIDVVAREYELLSTRAGTHWGYSVTSTYDVVDFIAQLMEKDPTHPILVAMAEAHPVAADGYDQNFGTAVLPGVIGTKWGWSNSRELHSSVSFGEDFIVAAAVTGSADDLTDLVESQLADEVAEATGSSDS